MSRAQGARSQLLLAFESTYGTAPSSGYTLMPFAASTLGMEQGLLESELLGYGRDPAAPLLDAISCDGDVDVPIDTQAMGFWLKGVFGAPTTTGSSGAYTHTFSSGSWALPSLALEVGFPEVPHFAVFSGAKVDKLAFQMRRSGLLTAKASVIAQGQAVDTDSIDATPDALVLNRFGNFNGQVLAGSVTPVVLGNVVSADVNYSNNLDRIETIRNDGKIDGADPSVASASGQIVMRFADSSLIDDAIAGTPVALSFGFSKGLGIALSFAFHEVYLSVPRLPVEGPGGVQATFDWRAAKASGLGKMATVTLKNDVASY